MPPDTRFDGEKPQPDQRRDWYSLSLDTVRVWGIVIGILGLLVIGLVGYDSLQGLSAERQALIVIDEAEFMLSRVQTEAGGGSDNEIYLEAWQNLQMARRQLSSGEYEEALVSARWSRNLFSSLLDDIRNTAPSGEAQFIGVQGAVEFRRGDGPWQVARSRIVLRAGDYVKTGGSGSAEVKFSDGSSFRVRSDTVVLINRRRNSGGGNVEDTVTLEYGWINLDTANRGSRVRTPEAEAAVASGSRVELAYDRSRRTSQFSSFEGSMEIRTRVGTLRRLGSMEQVTMTTAGMGESVTLPFSPTLLAPDSETIVQLAQEEVILRWRPVDGAARYALQISRDRHFIDNVIDVEDRSSTTARLSLREEGDFLWRVAAFNRQGFKGPWSEPQAFRVEDPFSQTPISQTPASQTPASQIEAEESRAGAR